MHYSQQALNVHSCCLLMLLTAGKLRMLFLESRFICDCFNWLYILILALFFISHSELDDQFLEAATTACPLIQSLILACCPLIGPSGLSTLEKLSNLTTLDLSYTFLTDLTPIYKSCMKLKVCLLSLSYHIKTISFFLVCIFDHI